MASKVEEFTLKLNEQISGGVATATTSLGMLDAAIAREQASLTGLEAKLSSAGAKLSAMQEFGSGASEAGIRKQAEAVAALGAAAAKARGNLDQLGSVRGLAEQADAMQKATEKAKELAKAEQQATSAAKGAAAQTGEVAGALGQLPGPAGAAGQKIGQMSQAFQKLAALGPVGIIGALTVVVVAAAAAFALAVVATAQWAVGLADAARTQKLLADGIAGSVAGGAALSATVSKLASTVPIASDELLRMAGELAKTGLKGDDLSKALEEAAIKAAKLKFGPDFAKEMLSLPRQADRLKANFANLFGGMKIEGLLAGLAKLVALFDANTASGKAIKFLFETLFQPIIDAATSAIPTIEAVFLTLVVWALKAYVAVKQFSSTPMGEALISGLKIIAIVIGVVVVAVALVGVAFIAVFAAIGAAVLTAVAVISFVVDSVVSGFGILVTAIGGVFDWLGGLSLADIGTNMIGSLAEGIASSAAAVVSAITGVVGGAISSAKALLGINSPSKVFAAIGASTGEGMTGGVEDGAPEVAAATAGMARGAAQAGASASADGAPGGGSKGGGNTYNFPNCVFGGDLTEDKLRGWMVKLFGEGQLDAAPALGTS